LDKYKVRIADFDGENASGQEAVLNDEGLFGYEIVKIVPIATENVVVRMMYIFKPSSTRGGGY